MIDRETAESIRDLALNAVSELSRALAAAQAGCAGDDLERVKRGVGLSIGRIQTELIDVVLEGHPDLEK
jgi:hypothetical protein